MTSIPEQWAEQAQYDIETARAMFDSGRFLYVLFCCQQAVEKLLKGLIAKRTNEFPPRLHNLMRLAEHAGLELETDGVVLMRELSGYYIQTRYPEEIEKISRGISRELARDILTKTEDATQWLSSMI